jgi:DNA primase
LALDADQAGVRAGLRSAEMALRAGFDVKIPTFPEGKDPADLARENPELLKAAIRTSKTAIEFFLDALRPGAKDERGYKQLVETELLPLIRAIPSRIDQEHFIHVVAGKIGVSEAAIQAEIGKKLPSSGVYSDEETEVPLPSPSSTAVEYSPIERKAGMLLFHFGRDSAVVERLTLLFGEARLKELEQAMLPEAEELRFRFDAELGEHTTEEIITEDMLGAIEGAIAKERFKMKFL